MATVRAVNIADLRSLAQRWLPRIVFDYIDGGAGDEITLRGKVLAIGGLIQSLHVFYRFISNFLVVGIR